MKKYLISYVRQVDALMPIFHEELIEAVSKKHAYYKFKESYFDYDNVINIIEL